MTQSVIRTALLLPMLLSFSASFITFSSFANAADLKQATQETLKNIRAGTLSQHKIDRIDDQTQQLLGQYKNKLQQLESLNAYNRQLSLLIEQQQIEQQRIEDEMQRVVETEREILPLIERMTLALEQFIALDIPFLPKERSDRIQQLKSLIQRPDVSSAEKFRRVMEAYQIENEYGRTLEAYQGTLLTTSQTAQPTKRTVDFLKVGRVSLIYQSLNGEETARWDQQTRSWQPLNSAQFIKNEIKHAFQVARRQASPDLLMLPFPAPLKMEASK